MNADALKGLSDDLLVEALQKTGDLIYFGELFRRHRRTVYQCCVGMLRDVELAADTTHDTFLKALEGISGYSGGQFRAWLLTITRHQCINQIRKRSRVPRSLEEIDGERELVAKPDAIVERLAVERMLMGLNGPQQLCLKMFYFNGMTYEEIGRLMGKTAGAVKSYIQNGKRRLKELQAERENDV
ncbi:MAG: RNA polymerase sigma factor [Acidobacteria bacterium]|nr:RNA polymerase sigma factor [Acidobacteriota bacterium]